MTRYKSLFITFVFLLLMTSNVFALPFEVGEKVVYKIKKFGITVGESTIIYKGEVQHQGQSVIEINVESNAANFYDKEIIYLDPKTFLPLKVIRQLNLWGKKENIEEQYFPKEGKVKIIKTTEKNDQPEVQTIAQDEPLNNIFAFIYYYRIRGSFSLNDSFKIVLPTQKVDMYAVKFTSLKVSKKPYKTLLLKSKPRRYKIWFDLSESRIPVRIDGAMGIGGMSMQIKEYNPQ